MASTEIAPRVQTGTVVTQRSVREISDSWKPKKSLPWGVILRHSVLMFFSLVVILPLVWVVIRSFMSLPDGTHNKILPLNWSDPLFRNYRWVLEKRPDVRINFW